MTQQVRQIAEARRGEPGALLPVLHAVQAELGRLDADAVREVAEVLNLSPAEVHGVVTFYRDFRQDPPARVRVRICRAEACQAVGSDALVEHARQRLGLDVGETRPDGGLGLEDVFCLGNCALGPSVTIDGRLHGRVDPARLDALLTEVS